MNTLKQEAHFGTEFGLSVVAQHLVYFSRSRSTVKEDFKYEVCRLKRRQNYIHHENLVTSLSSSSTQEFWKQVKKLSKSSRTSATSSSVVDGCSNVTDISNIFSSKLKSLNSDPDSQSRSCLFQLSVTPLTLLLSVLSVCLRRQCVMPSLNLSLVSVMVPLFLPTILSMLKKFFVSIYLSCLLP